MGAADDGVLGDARLIIVVAAAISDSLNDARAWTLVTIIGTGYILSRGIAKAGADHWARVRRLPR